jgi:hypothetical protein
VFAQLRDVLATENSAVVAEKNQSGGLRGPQGSKTYLPSIAIWKDNLREFAAEGIFHVWSMLRRPSRAVKPNNASTNACARSSNKE